MEVGNSNNNTMVDETYEFSAPKFFDFVHGETDEETEIAQHWFETALSYAPSPFMPRIKESRSIKIESLCDFSDVEHVKKDDGSLIPEVENSTRLLSEVVVAPAEDKRISIINEIPVAKKPCDENGSSQCSEEKQSFHKEIEKETEKTGSSGQGPDACTPELQKKNQTAKKIASLIKNPSSLKPKKLSNMSQANGVPSGARSAMTTRAFLQANGVPSSARSAMTTKTSNARSAITKKKTVTAPDFTQENQAIKRQKLEGGKSREILNVKPQNLTHNKSRLGITSSIATCSSSRARKEDRKLYVREEAVPFISTAEMVRRFQSGTSDSSVLNESVNSTIQRKTTKLTLTRPKEPDFETSHRVRSVRVKSSSELEEEMMANIPKFKARPVNKKILEAPTLQALPRSTPHLPEFQEFHLKTMERANQNAETSSVVSTESSQKNYVWNPHKLTEPKTPRLETLIRARPPKVKSTQELEQEELEKMPKFKARPLDKRIFESKGGMGMFRIPKGHVTKPQEFHFATDERIPPTKSVIDLFDKLSLNSESHRDNQIPRITTPNPFHLSTEERGAEKEKKFVVEVMQKQLEEERARIPKATPYPYTTDYPVIPPKPEPKHCTKPEPFQLESLVRHEEEMQREMEERQRLEREEAQMRLFKAQPILKEDPLPVPEKERKPLTQVEEFALHVDHRALDRAEFDKKIKEKEIQYKRYREESESAKLMEEEKALKQLRRTLVPHARPVPKFDNPFHPQKSSKETTKAKSPKLRVLQRKQRRTSASASQMR